MLSLTCLRTQSISFILVFFMGFPASQRKTFLIRISIRTWHSWKIEYLSPLRSQIRTQLKDWVPVTSKVPDLDTIERLSTCHLWGPRFGHSWKIECLVLLLRSQIRTQLKDRVPDTSEVPDSDTVERSSALCHLWGPRFEHSWKIECLIPLRFQILWGPRFGHRVER
jgi:hypothetical protein